MLTHCNAGALATINWGTATAPVYLAHQQGTSAEIWQQTQGQVSHLVATLGTCGTVMGLSIGLKAFNPAIQIIAVEPYMGHKLQGLKNLKESYCPEIFDKSRLDEKINIDDEEAFETTRKVFDEAAQHGLDLEMIDIGGPSMIRSAAKNHRDVAQFLLKGGLVPGESPA